MSNPRTPTKLDDAALNQLSGGTRIDGTSNNDTLTGTEGSDIIYSYNSQDSVDGGGGADIMNAGDGDDTAAGGAGHDTVSGGSGQDKVAGGTGNDEVFGNDGDDTLAGGTGLDRVMGGQGQDTILWHPGDGDDIINGGTSDDTLRLEDTGLTPEQLMQAIHVAPGMPMPQLNSDGTINLKGVTGTITIGNETIRFSDMEKLVLGGYTYIPGRCSASETGLVNGGAPRGAPPFSCVCHEDSEASSSPIASTGTTDWSADAPARFIPASNSDREMRRWMTRKEPTAPQPRSGAWRQARAAPGTAVPPPRVATAATRSGTPAKAASRSRRAMGWRRCNSRIRT